MNKILLLSLGLILALSRQPAGVPAGSDSVVPLPDVPFIQQVETGAIVYLGMSKGEAEAVTGKPVEEGRFGKNKFAYEGVTLAYRDDAVVYIWIDYEEVRWAANGVVMSGMPVESAFKALGILWEENISPYDIGYYKDGSIRQALRDDSPDDKKELQWMLSFSGKDTVGIIAMGDMMYLTRLQ